MVELLDVKERGAEGHAIAEVEVALVAAVAGYRQHEVARLLLVRGPYLKCDIDLPQRVDRDRAGTNWSQTILVMLLVLRLCQRFDTRGEPVGIFEDIAL